MDGPRSVFVAALLLDAIDSRLDLAERQAAALRAVEVSPAFAVEFLVEVVGEAYEALAITTGLPAAEVTMAVRRRLRQNSRVIPAGDEGPRFPAPGRTGNRGPTGS